MKKRILALALAGTTAFSVFGAAMSASAINNYTDKSTHIVYQNDVYKSYTAVDTITAKYTVETGNYDVYSFKTSKGTTVYTYQSDAAAPTGYYWREVVSDGTNNTTKLGNVVLDGDTVVALGLTWQDAYNAGKSVNDYSDVAVGTWVQETNQTYETGETTTIVNGNTTTTDVTTYTTTAPTVTSVGKGVIVDGNYVATGASTGYLIYSPVVASDTWNLTMTNIMDTPVVPGTVYLYDFYYGTPQYSSPMYTLANASSLAVANGNGAKIAALLDTKANDITSAFYAEKGNGSIYAGERVQVIDAWEEFLYELAIVGDNTAYHYYETEAQFIANYTDMYKGDPVYSAETGKLLGYDYVDLYNIDTLLHDIYQLNTSAKYTQANTSTLIYLMQQYDKYVNNYFDQEDVSSDEWGDLLIDLLEAANEENFKYARDYRYYVNKVDDLVDAYETATTVNQIAQAEREMYKMLTSKPYANATVSTTDLNNSLFDLYFNVKSLPSTYNTDATVAGTGTKAFALTGTTYTLYPMSDYYEKGNDNEVYAGNTGTSAFTAADATDEYEWFYNVYELAVKMKASNKYQGSIDAVEEALASAVAALEVTTSPAGSNVLAKEEMVEKYAGKIESDYDATYYGYYTLANDFADVAEGAAQTRNATDMVKEAGATLGYQGAQVTVTKNDMKTVTAAISDGEKALKAIKESSNYNAAQVSALNKAIAQAEALVELYEGNYSNSKSEQSVNMNYTTYVGDKDQMVKSDLTNAIEAINAAIKGSTVVQGWYNNGTAWQYGVGDEYLNDGWHFIDKVWYYFDTNGTAKQSYWLKDDGKWYYLNSNCGAARGWCKVENKWYYFDQNTCAMVEGWVKVDGNWYYLLPVSGEMATGWKLINSKWYYFSKESNSLGQMLYSTTTPDGYKLGADGAMIEK